MDILKRRTNTFFSLIKKTVISYMTWSWKSDWSSGGMKKGQTDTCIEKLGWWWAPTLGVVPQHRGKSCGWAVSVVENWQVVNLREEERGVLAHTSQSSWATLSVVTLWPEEGFIIIWAHGVGVCACVCSGDWRLEDSLQQSVFSFNWFPESVFRS